VENDGIFYEHLEYFMAMCYLGIFLVIWYKNLAPLNNRRNFVPKVHENIYLAWRWSSYRYLSYPPLVHTGHEIEFRQDETIFISNS
jgi:hypothetical protein